MKTGIKVIDAMTEKPISILADTNLKGCSKIMANEHIGALLVKNNGDLLGVITEQDIVRKGIALGLNPDHAKVDQVMAKDVITIKPDKDIFDALIMMRDNNIRHLPVIDGKTLIGLLTIKDVLKIEPQLFDIMVEKFELREESRKPTNKAPANEGICQSCGEYSEKLDDVEGTLLCERCKKE